MKERRSSYVKGIEIRRLLYGRRPSVAKVKAIVDSDPSRRVVVVSAAGKRSRDDHKLTDLLYLCYAHLQYGVSCDAVFDMIRSRYLSIRDELHLSTPLEAEFAAPCGKMDRGISQDELVSRGEYFAARLMADYLGYDFLDSTCWLRFRLDGTVDQPASYEALRRTASGRRVVIPGFYGAMPDGSVKTFTRGGSDITGALAAAALDADVYENWTDVSGFLMADPKIVQDPRPIERITYAELRGSAISERRCSTRGPSPRCGRRNIPLNIRNTNQPDHPGTMIRERFDEPGWQTRTSSPASPAARISPSSPSPKTECPHRPVSCGRSWRYWSATASTWTICPPASTRYRWWCRPRRWLRACIPMLGDLQKELKPDSIHVTNNMAIVAAVGRKMAYKPGTSGRIFAKLGENGINIRMITQGPEELNIIVGVDGSDFERAIRVLYDSFVK